MSPWTLVALSALVLAGSWWLMPWEGDRGEVRGWQRFFWWINAFYCGLWHRLDGSRRHESLPAHGAALLIANHTSSADPFLLQASCRRALHFMVAQEIYGFWLFEPICKRLGCIPVRRDGSDLAATRAALRALESGQVVPIFPEGRIIPTLGPSGREIAPVKPGVAFLALRAQVPVIPAFIWGTPQTRRIAQGMLTPSHAHVLFGPPVDLSDLTGGRARDKAAVAQAAERMRAALCALREQAIGEGT
jgi:1-acyl-sn-glycerol-3-phosphate acyltransferase